jgi:surface antigen
MAISITTATQPRYAKPVLAAIILSLGLTACDEQQVGTLGGAAAGAVAGRAIGGDGTGGYIGLILGAVVGGYLGGEIGKRLSNRDKEQMSQTTQQSLENGQRGQTSSWRNPDSGASGTVTPRSDSYKTANGNTCRDFDQSVSLQGQTSSGNGTACKNPDGTWRVVRG